MARVAGDQFERPDHAFPSETAAEVWLTRKEAEILDGEWSDLRRKRLIIAELERLSGQKVILQQPAA